MPHTWKLPYGGVVSDKTHTMYYRGQKIKEAYYRGEKVWKRGRYIKITRKPDKMLYYFGDILDLTGIQVMLIDPQEGTEQDITTNCVFVPADGRTITKDYVNVSYDDGGTILKTKLRLRVIIAIKVAVPPDHPEQEVGATYDYTGVVIHAVFNNGGEEDVTNQCIYNPVENSAITAEILNP